MEKFERQKKEKVVGLLKRGAPTSNDSLCATQEQKNGECFRPPPRVLLLLEFTVIGLC